MTMDYQDFWHEEPDFNATMLNETSNQTDYFSPAPTPVALEIIKLIMCIVGSIVDLLIIYIIIKYKDMQKPINIYIMNWLICGLLYMLVDPSEYRLYAALKMGYQLEEEVVCIMYTFVVILGTVEVVFMLVLMLQWFYDKKGKIDCLNRHYCKIVAAVWIFGFIEFLLTSSPCVYKPRYAHLGEIFLIFLKFIFFVCFVTLHGMRRCANPFIAASFLTVALITSFVLCWLPLILMHIINEFNYFPFIILQDFGIMLVYLYPLIAFYLFYNFDPIFAMCARILFRRNKTDGGGINNCPDEMEDRVDDNDIPA